MDNPFARILDLFHLVGGGFELLRVGINEELAEDGDELPFAQLPSVGPMPAITPGDSGPIKASVHFRANPSLAGVCVSGRVLVTEYGTFLIPSCGAAAWAGRRRRCQKQERKEWEAAFHVVT